MPALTGKTPAATFYSLLTINNTSGGLDTNLRLIGDGAGLQSPLQLSTSSIALNGQVWPPSGSTSGAYLRVSSVASNTLEWHVITSADITNALGFTPVGSDGGVISGPVVVKDLTTDTNSVQVATVNPTAVYSFTATNGGTVKFFCQVQEPSTNAFQAEEILVVTDGSLMDATSYAIIYTQSQLGSFDVSIASGVVSLTFMANTAVQKNVKVVANYMTA